MPEQRGFFIYEDADDFTLQQTSIVKWKKEHLHLRHVFFTQCKNTDMLGKTER